MEHIKEFKEVISDKFDEEMHNFKSDIPLLLKAWKAYEEKVLLEEKDKLKVH